MLDPFNNTPYPLLEEALLEISVERDVLKSQIPDLLLLVTILSRSWSCVDFESSKPEPKLPNAVFPVRLLSKSSNRPNPDFWLYSAVVFNIEFPLLEPLRRTP